MSEPDVSPNENPLEDSNPDAGFDSAAIDEAVSETANAEVAVGETRDEEMERLRLAASEADKKVLMAQADAENFRKRMRRDMEDQLKYAATGLVGDVLQVRDNLIRATEAASDSSGGVQSLCDGVQMVVKQLDDVLGKHGVKEIPAEGEIFDPNYHEAISQMPGDAPEGTVAHVATTGFQMHDRVVRPAQVIVSTGPAT